MKEKCIVTIEDDFDLEKIRTSGQIFRMAKRKVAEAEPVYAIVSGNSMLQIQKVGDVGYSISVSEDEFENKWHGFFDLNRDYSALRQELAGANSFVDMICEFGKGLRVLRQDPWEMIVTFIISQRRSMPAIATAVDKLCTLFGEDCGLFYAFPTPEKICSLTEDDIRACGVGYRAPYILDAARKVHTQELDLIKCEELSDSALFNELMKIKGVGAKVANCIMLFGFGRTSRAPVDVWIQRVIDEEFAGKNPFPDYSDVAGIVQQYMFFWKTQNRG